MDTVAGADKKKAVKKRNGTDILIRAAVCVAFAISVSVLLIIILTVIIRGAAHITPQLFSRVSTSANGSLFPALVNTLTVTAAALTAALPFGVFSAVYMNEYASKRNRFVKVVRLTSETLAGIPSIVFGLFGYLLFVRALSMGYSLMAGILTLAIMILPVIMKTTEEALRSVPNALREASFGLGAGKLRTVMLVSVPAAAKGILAGVILSTGRIVGETAALIFTAGTIAQIPGNLMGSGRTLSVHLYALWSEGSDTGKAYATAVVLLVISALLNILASYAAGKLTGNERKKRRKGGGKA